MNSTKHLIYDLDQNQIQSILSTWGEKPYRSSQIWQGLYKKLWQSTDDFTILPLETRQLLSSNFQFEVLRPINNYFNIRPKY